MFEVKEVHEVGPNGSDQMLIDEARNVWLQYIERFNLSGILRMKMVIDDMIIIFDVNERLCKSGEKPKRICSFASFNSEDDSGLCGSKYKKIDDEKEFERLMLMAIEGVIYFGLFYNGHAYNDGDIEFIYNNRIYTKGCLS